MGGLGSGTRRGQRKIRPIVEDFLNLDILYLNKEGLLKPGTAFKISYSKNNSDILSLSVTVGPESLFLQYDHHQKSRQQEIQLTRTPCHYGSKRTWLVCGKCGCKRNALYLGPKGLWACRECLGLVYHTQRLNPHERHADMAEKIKRKKLYITPENQIPVSQRPPKMGRKKHAQIIDQILNHEIKSLELFKNWVDGIVKKADKFI